MPKCGSFSELKTPSTDSKEILTKNFKSIVDLHEKLSDIKEDFLLSNHTYATQVVSGLNYKFNFTPLKI